MSGKALAAGISGATFVQRGRWLAPLPLTYFSNDPKPPVLLVRTHRAPPLPAYTRAAEGGWKLLCGDGDSTPKAFRNEA